MTRFHGGKVYLNCSICPFKCYSKSGMVKHQKAIHVVSSSELVPGDCEKRTIVGGDHGNIENAGNAGSSLDETSIEKDIVFESSGMSDNNSLFENRGMFENGLLFENNDLLGNLGIDNIEEAYDTNVNIDVVTSDDLGDFILENHLGKVVNFTENIIEYNNM